MEKALFSGVHFDRKRFKSDFQIFSRNKSGNEADEPSSSGFLGEHEGASGKMKTATVLSGQQRKSITKKEVTGDEGQEERISVRDAFHGFGSEDGSGPEKDELREEAGAVELKDERRAIEEVAVLRKKFHIKVSGHAIPSPIQSFEDLRSRYGCSRLWLRNLEAFSITEPSSIQRQAIPVLAEGRECFACAPTGSGKTIAYLLPILIALKLPSADGIRAIVLSPTRELAKQIQRELRILHQGRKFKSKTLTSLKSKTNISLSTSCDILIATPLRLNHLLEQKKVDLSMVEHLVLDESDKLFEMGFVQQIDKIMAACSNPKIVRSLFSATLPESVEALARSVMHDPVRIIIGERNTAVSTVDQKLTFVGSEEGKLLAVRQMIYDGLRPPVLVFLQSKERAKQLHRELSFEGCRVDVIHSDLIQSKREQAVEDFRSGKTWALIATDLVGRGMDFKGVNCVINYDLPLTTSDYIHRIGRSGRAGRAGKAVTLYTEEDKEMLRSIANVMVQSGCEAPSWMLTLPKMAKKRNRKDNKIVVPSRKSIGSVPVEDVRKLKRKRDMIAASKRRKKIGVADAK